jgi:hypothetical protein
MNTMPVKVTKTSIRAYPHRAIYNAIADLAKTNNKSVSAMTIELLADALKARKPWTDYHIFVD